MQTPDRLLRESADFRGVLQPLTKRQQACHPTLLHAAATMFADHGRAAFTLTKLARALRVAPASFQHHFVDLDALLFEIICTHLQNINQAIAAIDPKLPDAARLQRAAYYNQSRTGSGSFNIGHLLLVRDKPLLPEDLRVRIEHMQHRIGRTIAGEDAFDMLCWLDAPNHNLHDIECVVAAVPASRANRPNPAPIAAVPERLAAVAAPPVPAKPKNVEATYEQAQKWKRDRERAQAQADASFALFTRLGVGPPK